MSDSSSDPAAHADDEGSSGADDLIVLRPEGLYCPAGDFHIDPWRPVARAVITHAHADHARVGHGAYLASAVSAGVLRARLGAGIALQGLGYGEAVMLNGVRVSLHPAGHVLGSAQVRVEHRGRVWVASGDYFVSGIEGDSNATCAPFEPVRCHCFITESTFGLPIYRWRAQAAVQRDGAGLDAVRAHVEAVSGRLGRRIKFLVGKPGLDGHSNGAEQIAVRARDCGMEVVYEGIRLTPAQIIESARDEGVHLIGLSILSGSHLRLVPEILDGLKAEGLEDVPVIVGGIIPEDDAESLRQAGVARVYTPKDFQMVRILSDMVRKRS